MTTITVTNDDTGKRITRITDIGAFSLGWRLLLDPASQWLYGSGAPTAYRLYGPPAPAALAETSAYTGGF